MARNYEKYNRKRNIYCGFRLSPKEKERLRRYVALSGMTERDYVTHRALQEDVVVVGNSRVYKALKDEFAEIVSELKRIGTGQKIDSELAKVIGFALKIYKGMNEANNNEK
ncbi:MAG: hypothetical protein IKE50_04270 [Erysipelotrichaceae bacterium]|nr:hypothetical protein [Erysipelotrichaceae bacterium]MBR3355972.1 hypothetical protein [Oscillospiraceae bacterium]